MTCAEFRELAALYAAGGLSEADRAAADAHLAEQLQHDGCFEALRTAAAGTEALARSLTPVRPEASLWRSIEARLRSPGMRLRERVAWALAGAAAILLFATLSGRSELTRVTAQLDQSRAACLDELSRARTDAVTQKAALAVLLSPTGQVVSLAPQPGAAGLLARALVDRANRKLLLLSPTLAPPASRDYQVWVIRGAEPAGGSPNGKPTLVVLVGALPTT